MKPLHALVMLGLALAVAGCPKKDDVIVEAAEGKALSEQQIDADPLALLPGGAIGMLSADAKALFASQFGQKLAAIAQAPMPASAGFDATRDLTHLYAGFYSMQGADFTVVATGSFDKARIEQAADGVTQTPLGAPLVKSSYAKHTLYTSRNVGFTVLTARTALVGNETGIRRALDRIQEGRVKRAVPDWFSEIMDTPNAPMVMGFDLRAHPLTDATRQQFPFLQGLETARMVGNFEAPGLNLAGTLTYSDEASATQGAQNLRDFASGVQSLGWLASLFNIPQPIRKLEAEAKGTDTQFVAGLDGEGVAQLLDQALRIVGVPVQPKVIPATVSPGVTGEAGVPQK